MHTTAFRLARGVVVIALALVGFLVFMRPTNLDHNLLSNLLIERISIPGLPSRPDFSTYIKPTISPFSVLKRAGKTDPTHTGIYEKEWTHSAKASSTNLFEAGLLLQLLPDSRQARQDLADSKTQFVTKPDLTGQTLYSPDPFSIPSVPQAYAQSHVMTLSGTERGDGFAYTAVFQVGRAVIAEVITLPGLIRSTSQATKVAQDEHALLLRDEPDFSMFRTTTPVLASAIFWVIAVLLAAAAFFLPEWAPEALSRRRASHAAKDLERARSQYRARGRRAVRRHRAPAWRQPGRR